MTQAPARPTATTFESLNPANGDVVGTHPIHTERGGPRRRRPGAARPPRGGRPCRSTSAPST